MLIIAAAHISEAQQGKLLKPFVGQCLGAAGRHAIGKLKATPNQHVDILSPQTRQHILHGDNNGGGHLWPGRPGKTAFPKNWSADKIIHEVGDIVTPPQNELVCSAR